MTVEVGGLCEVMSWVMGFGRHAEVLEPEHLRKAVMEELTATAERYAQEPAPIYQEDSEPRTL
jgi:predicted DNA-binding transcriptional regulator YafY